MTTLAALPMYDWPVVRAANDALWQVLRIRLLTAGLPAPKSLYRGSLPLTQIWKSPGLLLAQTCGLPYVSDLAGDTRLIATPTYDLPDCGDGMYCSRIVVRRDHPAERMDDLTNTVAAINGRNSQSGFAALAAVTPGWNPHEFYQCLTPTGSHLASLRAVADGNADVAAIDAVSFALAKQHYPDQINTLRILISSPETPGLPLITNRSRSEPEFSMLTQIVLDTLNDPATAEIRRPLLITGAVARTDRDYDPIRKMARRIRRAINTETA